MQIKSLLLAASAAVTVLGFNIPEGQSDGYYRHTIENGTDVHVKLAEPYFGPMTKRTPLFHSKDPVPANVYCGRAKNLNREDTDGANADLDRQCGNGGVIGGGNNFYAIRGGTVAFVCNFGYFWTHHRCFDDLRAKSTVLVTDYCGEYNSGWTNFDKGMISYGYDTVASDYCGTDSTVE